jgi:hypothetical protein
LITQLTIGDFRLYPVWNYSEDKLGYVVASPVLQLPVDSLEGRLIGCQVILSNGHKQWGNLSNIDLHNEKATSHFLTFSVTREKKWFHLARYFDVDYAQRGPRALSAFLQLPVEDIFPIAYDIGRFVTGSTIPTAGLISQEPQTRLSQDELIAMSLG